MKISVEKQLMFTANCSCSVLREKQHSWQNNLPLGPDLNPRKARESLPCFLVQAIFILSIPWTSYTLVKIGWTCRPRHRKKWKIFSGLLTSFGQKNLWNRLLDALLQRDRKRKAWNNYFYKKKKKDFFPFKSLLFVYFIWSKFCSLNFKDSEYH